MLTTRKDEALEMGKIEENAVLESEKEFSFEIEELDSQHAMMMIIPMDVSPYPPHHSTP